MASEKPGFIVKKILFLKVRPAKAILADLINLLCAKNNFFTL